MADVITILLISFGFFVLFCYSYCTDLKILKRLKDIERILNEDSQFIEETSSIFPNNNANNHVHKYMRIIIPHSQNSLEAGQMRSSNIPLVANNV